MKERLEWIESGGGPLLLAAKSVVKDWTGTNPTGDSAESTDYDRACAVEDEIGVISIGTTQAIVLGDEPDRTALVEHPSGLLILRWRWAESEDSLVSALLSTDIDQLSFNSGDGFLAQQGDYVLFDSACCGAEITHSLMATLQAGAYFAETVLFKPNESVCALIHRLRIKGNHV